MIVLPASFKGMEIYHIYFDVLFMNLVQTKTKHLVIVSFVFDVLKMEMKTQFHTVEDGGLRTQMVEIMREMVALSTLMKLRIGIE